MFDSKLPIERVRHPYLISTDRSLLQIDRVHSALSDSYWSRGIPKAKLEQAIEGSLAFGLYFDRGDRESLEQIGFARVITDAATFAYLCDVYVNKSYQSLGLGHWMMETIMSHPSLQSLRRFVLVTRDAHWLYSKFGFQSLSNPAGYMERFFPDIYSVSSSTIPESIPEI